MPADLDLAEIERCWAAATPGPWPDYNDPDVRAQCWSAYDYLLDRDDRVPIRIPPSDSAAIAAAPKHVAALVAEVKRLRALRERLLFAAAWARVEIGPCPEQGDCPGADCLACVLRRAVMGA